MTLVSEKREYAKQINQKFTNTIRETGCLFLSGRNEQASKTYQ